MHWWVTKPLASNVTLTGNVGATVFTQILGQVPGNVILCLTVYKVVKPLKATGEFDGGTTRLNGNDCAGQDTVIKNDPAPSSPGADGAFPDPDDPGPIEPRPISLSGNFLGCPGTTSTHEIAAGQRLAIVLTAGTSGPRQTRPRSRPTSPPSDAVVLYDHFDYQSTLVDRDHRGGEPMRCALTTTRCARSAASHRSRRS